MKALKQEQEPQLSLELSQVLGTTLASQSKVEDYSLHLREQTGVESYGLLQDPHVELSRASWRRFIDRARNIPA